MLGFDALGRLALGQVSSQTATTDVLVADKGSFALTGKAAAFQVQLASVAGAFTLTGIGAAFVASFSAAAGSYAFTGEAAAFTVSAALNTGGFALTGIDASFTTTVEFNAGAFAFAGIDASFRTYLAAEGYAVTITFAEEADRTDFVADTGAFSVSGGEAAYSETIHGADGTRRKRRRVPLQTVERKIKRVNRDGTVDELPFIKGPRPAIPPDHLIVKGPVKPKKSLPIKLPDSFDPSGIQVALRRSREEHDAMALLNLMDDQPNADALAALLAQTRDQQFARDVEAALMFL
jgi:hypothetical protein